MSTPRKENIIKAKKPLSQIEKRFNSAHPPAIGGGSADKAIEILHKALAGGDQFDNFISHVWLGNAYQKKNNSTKAVKRYHNALQIYPNSPWVKDLLAEIE